MEHDWKQHGIYTEEKEFLAVVVHNGHNMP